MRWAPAGPDNLLIYFAEAVGDDAFHRGRALSAALDRNPPAGLLEYVPSFTSVLLEFAPGTHIDVDRIISDLTAAPPASAGASRLHTIPVRYDGADLAPLAARAGLSESEVVALHSGHDYKVYSLGFAPGFAYLGDLDPRLHTPRRRSPRPRVAAGSVAIGGEHTGVYPFDGPGGWHLIGRTDTVLLDPEGKGEECFRLRPGDRVRFVPVS